MDQNRNPITVFYDGACPSCVRDRSMYERLAGDRGDGIHWFDITGEADFLRRIGIDPQKAERELHVKDPHQQVVSEIDAYILLMRNVPVLRPLAWIVGLPLIRPALSRIYRQMVDRRLQRTGRLQS